MSKGFVHGFIPNTAPGRREEMLREIGFKSVDEIYDEIPEKLRFKGKFNIPAEPRSELEVARKIEGILARNKTMIDLLSFLGAGCWPHYVPALCDEIMGRSEFLTAYAGSATTDLGRYQALFEFQSLMGDLLEMDVVSGPIYDGPSACGDAALMAARVNGRRRLLVPDTMSPDRLVTLKLYAQTWLSVEPVKSKPHGGELDLGDLEAKLGDDVAAVFIENPTYLGVIESQGAKIARLAHACGALLLVFVYPTSLGVVAPPARYGADVVCGEGQPFGARPYCGGATLGFLACADEERLVRAMPSFLISATDTEVEGERAYYWHAVWDRIFYSAREKAKSFTGTSSALWAIGAAVYMALLGPQGMKQLGMVNMQKAGYAARVLAKLPGVKAPLDGPARFNEFPVNFDATGKTVARINEVLLERGILGGKDISREFPALGQSALYCVTETHTKDDIDRLAQVLGEAVR